MPDLHTERLSHMSAPISDGDVEFHLSKKETGGNCKVGEKYFVAFPVRCTSIEGNMERFERIGKPHIEDYNEEQSEVSMALTKAGKRKKKGY